MPRLGRDLPGFVGQSVEGDQRGIVGIGKPAIAHGGRPVKTARHRLTPGGKQSFGLRAQGGDGLGTDLSSQCLIAPGPFIQSAGLDQITVYRTDCRRIGQVAGRRWLVEQRDPLTRFLARGAEPDDRGIVELGFVRGDDVDGIGQPIRQLSRRHHASRGISGFDARAVDARAGHRLSTDILDLPIDRGELAMDRLDPGIEHRDLLRRLRRAGAVQAVGDDVDRFLELLQSIAIAVEKADSKRANGGGQLVAQDLQRGCLLRGDEDPSAERQIVTNDIGDGVGFCRCPAAPARPPLAG